MYGPEGQDVYPVVTLIARPPCQTLADDQELAWGHLSNRDNSVHMRPVTDDIYNVNLKNVQGKGGHSPGSWTGHHYVVCYCR